MNKHNIILHWNVKCCVEFCSNIKKDGYGYLKDRTYFGKRPIILCQTHFNTKKENDYMYQHYKHLPKYIWNPLWYKPIWISKTIIYYKQ